VERSLRRTIEEQGAHDTQHNGHQNGAQDDGESAAHLTRLPNPPPLALPAMVLFRSIAPILPTADMGQMQSHYEKLGFTVQVHHGGYATATRDGINLHFRLTEAHDPRLGGALYIAVDDADALHAEWVAAGVGETDDLFDPGFGVWEAAHTDPDGNLIRFGSPVAGTTRP
jgi:hypothetical protein